MSDPVERELRNLLDERARGDPLAAQTLADGIASLPGRRRFTSVAAFVGTAAVITAVVVAIAAPRLAGIGGDPSPAPHGPTPIVSSGPVLPGGPEAFADDPRLAQCFGLAPEAEYAFVMDHARDYQRYFPHILLAPELDVDASAFVVVFRDGWSGPPTSGNPRGGPRPTPVPGHRFVCVLVDGEDAILYADVDIAGLTTNVVPEPPPTPQMAPMPSSIATAGPAPAWVSDLAGQLECDEIAAIGYDRGAAEPVGHEGTASPYPWLEALDEVDLPLSVWEEEPKTSWEGGASHFVRFVNRVENRVKAIILMEGTSVQGGRGSWEVTAYRACIPAEFDPLRGRTTDDAPWFDSAGVESDLVYSNSGPLHCGWESAVLLHVNDALFLRDPLGLFSNIELRDYETGVDLPDEARHTGLQSIRWELYVTDDPDQIWTVDPTGTVESWPRSSEPFIGCA